MLIALDMLLGPTPEIVILGEKNSPSTTALLAALNHRYLPNKVVALRGPSSKATGSLDPLFKGKQAGKDATVFVCQNFSCQAPVEGAAALQAISAL